MKVYYALTSQLTWVKVESSCNRAEDFLIILDEENFKKLISQAVEIIDSLSQK